MHGMRKKMQHQYKIKKKIYSIYINTTVLCCWERVLKCINVMNMHAYYTKLMKNDIKFSSVPWVAMLYDFRWIKCKCFSSKKNKDKVHLTFKQNIAYHQGNLTRKKDYSDNANVIGMNETYRKYTGGVEDRIR